MILQFIYRGASLASLTLFREAGFPTLRLKKIAPTPSVTSQKAEDETAPANHQQRFSWKYPIAFLSSVFAVLMLLWTALTSLDSAGLLPPPQLTNNFCADVKLEFLRKHPIESPTVLAVGSSVTLRTLDGRAIQQASDDHRMPLNSAFCGLKINQTVFTAEYFLSRFPTIRDVVTIVAPQDLTECWFTPSRVFNPDDVDDYVFRRRWPFPLYLSYFDPLVLIKNVMILRAMKIGTMPLDAIKFDRYGSAPLYTAKNRPDLVYGPLPPLDPACFSALRGFARELAKSGRRLVIVSAPVNPEWKKLYDPDGSILHRLAAGIQTALAGTTSIFWDADSAVSIPRPAFTDAIHLHWPAAKRFSVELVAATGLGQQRNIAR